MDSTSKFTRTRIAPTSSGFLHLGNVLSFVITIGLARKTGATVLLRIDDMDQERYQDDYVQDIFNVLEYLELPYDEGPRNLQEFREQYSQIHRLPMYQQALQHLQTTGKVFACTCSRSQLQQGSYAGTCIPHNYPLHSPNANWRLFTETAELKLKTLNEQKSIALPEQMQYFVVKKKDGKPAYQLASVIDDLHFKVDLVVRGLDLWPSTIAQLCLAQHLPPNSFHQTTFYHHPLLTDKEGNKLSKTAGSVSIQHLMKEGKKKEEIYKLLATLAGLPEKEVHNCESLATQYFKTASTPSWSITNTPAKTPTKTPPTT
jgi:glutamyl/glutaminyl-tRNA synthetase